MLKLLKKLFQKNKLNLVDTDKPYPSNSDRLNSERGINFTVYKAIGGTVIETRTYDKHKDRHNMCLYVITDDKDLGNEIGKIITVESLKF